MIDAKNCIKCDSAYTKPYTTSAANWIARKYCTKECRKLDPKLKTPRERTNLRARKNRLKRVFGITLADYDRMFLEQQGRCKICSKHQSEFRTSLAVDHCHITGRVRGLLCTTCNRAIGMLNDDPALVTRAATYLS